MAAEVVEGVGDGSDDVLHRQSEGSQGRGVVDGHGLEQAEQRGAVLPWHVRRRFHHVVAQLGRDGNERHAANAELGGHVGVAAADLAKAVGTESDKVRHEDIFIISVT